MNMKTRMKNMGFGILVLAGVLAAGCQVTTRAAAKE